MDGRHKESKLTIFNLIQAEQSRREFLKKTAIGSSAIVLGTFFVKNVFGQRAERPTYSMVLVDYNKCTGCRTCETVCSAFNHKVRIGDEEVLGLGNPYYSKIRVYSFNPDVDIPVTCLMCRDNPCIEACPVEPDPKTGRKALYRDEKTLSIKNDIERCIGCGACAEACRTKRIGAIIQNPETGKPERICTLCDGDPQCVKYCPYGALTHVIGRLDGRHYGYSVTEIVEKLKKLWYYNEKAE